MKMKKTLFILIALLAFTSCKKENKIKRNLYNNGGKWEIVKYEESVTSDFSLNNKNIVNENVGIIFFKEDQSGWIIKSDGIETIKANFKYENSDTELLLGYSVSAPPEHFDLTWEKNSFTMNQNSTSTYTVYYPPTGDSLTITDNTMIKYTCEKM